MTELIIDAASHPFPVASDDLRRYMSEPFAHLRFPTYDAYFYPPPHTEYMATAIDAGGLPGSDPTLFDKEIFGNAGTAGAILLPLTRGLLPDLDMANEICSATNRWLADQWLARDPDRLFGSIRINPADPVRAIREIDEWATHPQMVQIAVPLQAHQPYGQRIYRPIWERAAFHGLPVAVHADALAGNEFWPTAAGYPFTYAEFAAQNPINYTVHLLSLIAEGVLEEQPDLTFVFADGGLDMLFPILWRSNADWRPLRSVTPWVKRNPLTYLKNQVRFCSNSLEGPTEREAIPKWIASVDAEHLLMYASNYPFSSFQAPSAFNQIAPATRARILGGAALECYPKLRRKHVSP